MSFLGDPTSVTAWATIVLALATILLVGVTIYYAIRTNSILDETRKAREINYIERKLERFYLPLQNSLRIYKDEEDEGDPYPSAYLIQKATLLDKKVSEVENHNYLASPELKKLISTFQETVYYFNNKSIFYETDNMYNKMDDLLKKIEERLGKDIKECLEKIDKLTF